MAVNISKDFAKRYTGKAKASVEKFANITKGANGIALAIKDMLVHFNHDDARDVLICVNAHMAAKRKAQGIVERIAKDALAKSRVSEIAGILRLRQWTCCNAALDMLNSLDAPKDTIVYVSKRIRELEKTAPCPARAQFIKWINGRKAGRNATGKGKSKKKINPVVAITAIGEHLKKLATTYGKSDGASFITAMVKACKSYVPYAEKIVEASKPAKEEAKAKK
jgi:hypothetical protein